MSLVYIQVLSAAIAVIFLIVFLSLFENNTRLYMGDGVIFLAPCLTMAPPG